MPSTAAYATARLGDQPAHRIPWVRRSMAILLTAFTVFLTACTGAASNRVDFLDADRWKAQFTIPFDSETKTVLLGQDTDPPLAEFQTGVQSALASLGITVRWTARTDRLEMALSGGGGTDQVGRLFYGELSGLIEPFAPGNEITLTGAVQAGEALTFTLESSLTSGYAWQEKTSQGLRLLASGDFDTVTGQAGAPLRQTLYFEARETGSAAVTLVYRRPWEEPPPPARSIALHAPRLSQLADLSYPERQDVAAVMTGEPTIEVLERIEPLSAQLITYSLPPVFDWRAMGKVPPVRNQGACGSCWAFATVGVMESAIMIRDGRSDIDLSEQFLVSCNQERWGCSGGATAHDYHWWKKAVDHGEAGAVYEVQFPYEGVDASCRAVTSHPYRISDWAYIPGTTPVNVDAIKQAIYEHGPVKASVCAGPAYANYRGGVFATDESQVCGGWTNHAVILVGWDDTQGENGVWIMRNSWGTSWGEGGYMLIDRRVSNIGRNASYVVYNGDGQVIPGTPRIYLPTIVK